MLTTRNIMEDFYFSNASDLPTIVNFVVDLGEAVVSTDVYAVNKFNYKIL